MSALPSPRFAGGAPGVGPGDGPAVGPVRRSDRSTIFMVSLFLVLLAFFLLLNVISEFEERRSRAVLDSLSVTFDRGPVWNAGGADAGGDGLGYDRALSMQREVARLFETAIGVVRVQTPRPGRLMEIALAADALFEPGSARVRDGIGPLVENVARAIAGAPPALRYDVEFFAHPAAPPAGTDAAASLEVARAAAFAAALVRWNAPPETIAAGVERGAAGEVVLRFHTRRRDRDRVTFDPGAGDSSMGDASAGDARPGE